MYAPHFFFLLDARYLEEQSVTTASESIGIWERNRYVYMHTSHPYNHV